MSFPEQTEDATIRRRQLVHQVSSLWGLEFDVRGFGFGFKGLGFRVQGLELLASRS